MSFPFNIIDRLTICNETLGERQKSFAKFRYFDERKANESTTLIGCKGPQYQD